MKPYVNALVIVLFIGLVQRSLATYMSMCAVDFDCSIADENCLSLRAMGCSRGYCVCKKGMDYNFNRTACVDDFKVPLGGACTGSDFERHVQNAGCNAGISTCFFGFSKYQSTCKYNFGKACADTDTDCGISTALTCKNGTCQCMSGYEIHLATGVCVLKDAGSSCSVDGDCWALSPSFGTGYACLNGVCGCSSSYQLVKITDIDMNESDETMRQTTANYCFASGKGSSFHVGAGRMCLIWPYSFADSNVTACDSRYGCYACPEDGALPGVGYGLCRRISGISPTSSPANTSLKPNSVSPLSPEIQAGTSTRPANTSPKSGYATWLREIQEGLAFISSFKQIRINQRDLKAEK